MYLHLPIKLFSVLYKYYCFYSQEMYDFIVVFVMILEPAADKMFAPSGVCTRWVKEIVC